MIFTSENPSWRFVAGNSEAAMVKIFTYLEEKCGRDFRLVCFKNTISGGNDRARALRKKFPEWSFEEIIANYTFEAAPEGLPDADYFHNHFVNAEQTTVKLLKEHPEIKGIAYMDDIAAMGGATALMKSGRRDVIVTGFNDDAAAGHFPYPITTVRHDIGKIVTLLVEKAVSRDPAQILVMPEIIIRQIK